jgi:hypothetical protein
MATVFYRNASCNSIKRKLHQASCNSIKRKLKEMLSPTSIETKAPKKKNRPTLSFRDDDLINRKLSHHVPLMIIVGMANHDVCQIKGVPATSCTQNFSTPYN